MKKFLIIAAALFASSLAFADVPGGNNTYTGDLINTAVCTDTTPVLNLNANNIGPLSFQTIYSSGIFSNTTFTDGRASTGSITVASNTNFTIRAATDSITVASTASLAATKASNRITIASNTALSGAVLTINGIQLIEGRDWTKTATSTGTAVALKNLLLNFPGITASTASNVVYTTATAAGVGGNAFSMTSSTPAAMTVLSANFTGGNGNALTGAYITVNGTKYLNGYLWTSLDANGVDNSTMTATSLASLLGNISGISAQAVGSVVTATATTAGTAGNSFTLSASTSALTVASANFTGGRATTTITINGTVLTNGVDWTTGGTSSATAKSISDAIAANSSLNTLIVSTWNASAVVTATASVSGTVGNYAWSTNNTGSLTLTNSSLVGGSNASWVVNTPTITITGHGYPLGLGVLYSTGTISITGLTNQTTYYVIPVDANNIKLASSKSNAVAGTAITLASLTANGQHTFTLAPLAVTGSASWKWQESNDNANWADLSVATVTFSSPFTSASTFWDFGSINPNYLRLNIVSPTSGCVNIRAKGNGRSLQ